MRKVIIVSMLVLTALTACNCGLCEDNPKKKNTHPEMKYTPEGAKFVKDLKGFRGLWIKWELNGECFMSYNLAGNSAVLTKVDCPL